MAISPLIRAIIRVLDRFLYRGLYHCPCCVARRVDSRRVLGGCAQNAPSPRHSTRKENRSLPLHNCILRNITVIGLLGDHRFVSIETPPQNLGILNRDISNQVRARFREKRILGSVRPTWILMDFRRTITQNDSLARERQDCIAQTFNSRSFVWECPIEVFPTWNPIRNNAFSWPAFVGPGYPLYRGSLDYGSING